ncbi:MAG: hypothetical protein RLZZ399_2090 [Verrucomicrobiota bacterium]|jgi:hypothetical protein
MSTFSQIKLKTHLVLGGARSVGVWGARFLGGLFVGLVVFGGAGFGELRAQSEAPSGAEILGAIRQARTGLQQTFTGKIRRGDRSIPYQMNLEGAVTRFEFRTFDGKILQRVVIRMGAFDATLEVRDGEGQLQKTRFEDEVLNMGVTYEDLALRFLFWQGGNVEGAERVMLFKCWKLRVKRPEAVPSRYREVVLSVRQSDFAFLKSEAYGEGGMLMRTFTVKEIQASSQGTIPKKLQIAPAEGDASYLEVDGEPTTRPPR